MGEEDVAALQEELAAAQAEVERLQSMAADGEARAAQVEAQLAEARTELESSGQEAQARADELTASREREQTLETEVEAAAQRYRELALEQSPELPQELVTGRSVDEIDASLQRARETVSRVRGHIESQAQAGRVPVGAPARSGPDLSALSAEEKIRLGLERRS